MEKESNSLFDAIEGLHIDSFLGNKRERFVTDEPRGISLFAAYRFHKRPSSFAIVATNLYAAQTIYENLLSFFPEEKLAFFPADELLRSEVLSSSRELLSQRLYAMGQLRKEGPHILITHPAALLRYLPDPSYFDAHCLRIKKGCSYDIEGIKESLLEMGYHRVNKVDQSLQFALRGDILDVFSVNLLSPIRIEFFGDDVESVKSFDVATQSSNEEMAEVEILPATDLLLSEEDRRFFEKKVNETLSKDASGLPSKDQEALYANVGKDVEDLLSLNYRSNLYKYMGFARENAISIIDYFNPEFILAADKEGFEDSCSLLLDEASSYLRDLRSSFLAPSGLREYMPVSMGLKDESKVFYASKFSHSPSDIFFNVRPVVRQGNGIAAIAPTVSFYLKGGNRVVIFAKEEHKRNAIRNFLSDAGIAFFETKGLEVPDEGVALSDFSLDSGFEIPSLRFVGLGSGDLFGPSSSNSRFSSRFKNATILKSYEDLRPGDYVVHEYNGIGQFIEITTLEDEGVHKDYLKIAYANDETLYVPLEQFRLVRKYSGREGASPRLSHLFSGEWEKKKAKIKERVNELADRLIALYGNRANSVGFAFPKDDELQARFESEFPYPLTPDQKRSLEEIKADMEKPEIMDRLLCGDVGFGKTEIAFRAAFKAIDAGKQVALLCPTTLLARQHYSVALERFASFGVRIGLLSRLVPLTQQKSVIDALERGEIDLLIGTHRLLSKDVRYKNLSLLIVDEEQRFGVEQKEKIKEIRQNVDVLTLSATPIPRTLQMSLVGIRPLSEINTAPDRRMPIQTYVTPCKPAVVAELIGRELSRGGQVFYVYNKVMSIYQKGNELAKAVPQAKIGIVHGQMEKEEIEDVMQRFYLGEVNLLICTSIVENGIDVPNANMIIVEDADRFGLSQLYQIKGRVGRGNRIAYAYLTYRAHKEMNEDAQKRLKAIQEFTELGSGYKIAQRDLMIRGAGDILGPEQAGFIDSVGLDLYLKLLNEAIEKRKKGAEPTPIAPSNNLSIDAYIPKDYAIESDKIELYQELENASDEKTVSAFEKHVRDVYGKLPKEFQTLIKKRKVDILAGSKAIMKLQDAKDSVRITCSDSFSHINGIGMELFEALSPYLSKLKVTFSEKRLVLRLEKGGDWLEDLYQVLLAASSLWEKHQNS